MKVLTMSEAKSQIKEGKFECIMDLKVGIVEIRTHKNKYKYIQVEEDSNFKMVPINKLLLTYCGGEEIDREIIMDSFGKLLYGASMENRYNWEELNDYDVDVMINSSEEVELSWVDEHWAIEYSFDFLGDTYCFQANEIFI